MPQRDPFHRATPIRPIFVQIHASRAHCTTVVHFMSCTQSAHIHKLRVFGALAPLWSLPDDELVSGGLSLRAAGHWAPVVADVGQLCAELDLWIGIGHIPVDFDLICADIHHLSLDSVRCRPGLGCLGRTWAEPGQILGAFDQCWARANSCPFRPDVGRTPQHLGPIRPTSNRR